MSTTANSENKPINLEGVLDTAYQTIIGPLAAQTTKIVSMIFNDNDSSYTLEVSKAVYNGTTVILYKLDLEAGDVVFDYGPYLLDSKTSIIAKSSSTTTNYLINGHS